MVEQGQQITQAVSIPVIGDGDNGYGNAMNVKRTVKGYIKAGFAGIILEDQVDMIEIYFCSKRISTYWNFLISYLSHFMLSVCLRFVFT